MRIQFIVLALIFLISCQNNRSFQNKTQKKATQIKVAAYNVEYGKSASAAEFGEALKPYNFDVVCFSEAPGGGWTKEAGAIMGLNYAVVGKYSTAGHADKFKTIASKTPLYDYEEVLMADTLHTATRVKTKINGTEFAIYAVHFPFGWRDQAHIDETTNKVVTFVNYLKERQNTELAIVAGDFNFIPVNADTANAYHQLFMNIGMDVSWKELGIDCTVRNTFNAQKPEDNGSGEVIDHIMYNPEKMKAVDGEIMEWEKQLADHKPIWTLLELK